ncbi:MAG: hypothetical protein SVR94_12890, partial [Pseudomonadota bacterium]|nr:hypothetical protein [Pseudomonadota bacterium]
VQSTPKTPSQNQDRPHYVKTTNSRKNPRNSHHRASKAALTETAITPQTKGAPAETKKTENPHRANNNNNVRRSRRGGRRKRSEVQNSESSTVKTANAPSLMPTELNEVKEKEEVN